MIERPAGARTAQEAAGVVGCEVDRIARPVIAYAGEEAGPLTAARGARPEAAGAYFAARRGWADAAVPRDRTDLAIGGAAPIAHRSTPCDLWDPRLDDPPSVQAAARIPCHVFEFTPAPWRPPAMAATAPASSG